MRKLYRVVGYFIVAISLGLGMEHMYYTEVIKAPAVVEESDYAKQSAASTSKQKLWPESPMHSGTATDPRVGKAEVIALRRLVLNDAQLPATAKLAGESCVYDAEDGEYQIEFVYKMMQYEYEVADNLKVILSKSVEQVFGD